MKNCVKLLLSTSLVLALLPFGFAAASADAPGPCVGEHVAGTVVAVDESAGQVTIETGEGVLCTVSLGTGDFDHPIVNLLGRYFSEVSLDDLAAALDDTAVWVVCDDAGGCALAEAGDEGAVAGRVSGIDEHDDGSFTLLVVLVGETEPVEVDTDDAETAAELADALEQLAVEWALSEGEDGPVVSDAGDEIAQLHEDGLGFGVIVKLYAMAEASQAACEEDTGSEAAGSTEEEPEACGVTVEELVGAFQSGTGMGELFRLYGKPALLGVGHVRKALAAEEDAGADGDAAVTVVQETSGRCSAKKNGKQNRNPHCQGVNSGAPDTTTTTETPATTNNSNGNGNGGGGGNGNGNGHGGGNNGGGNGNGGGNNGNGGGNGGNNGGGNGGGRP